MHKNKKKITLKLRTTTDIYFAFLNATILHSQSNSWKQASVMSCIKGGHSLKCNEAYFDECCAFQHVHGAAFKMFFEKEHYFHIDKRFIKIIDTLDFVSIEQTEGIDGFKVKYTFSHSTFLEFFTAIHLATLSERELISYIVVYRDKQHVQKVWQFFFGIVGNKLRDQPPVRHLLKLFAVENPLDRDNFAEKICDTHVHSSVFELVKEIGWKGKDIKQLLQSAGVISNKKELCVRHDSTMTIKILLYIKEITKPWKINLTIILEDQYSNIYVQLRQPNLYVHVHAAQLNFHTYYEIKEKSLLDESLHENQTQTKFRSILDDLRSRSFEGLPVDRTKFFTRVTIQVTAEGLTRDVIGMLPTEVIALDVVIVNEIHEEDHTLFNISEVLRHPQELNYLTITNAANHQSVLNLLPYFDIKHLQVLSLTGWHMTESSINQLQLFVTQNTKLLSFAINGLQTDSELGSSIWISKLLNHLPMGIRGLQLVNVNLTDEHMHKLSKDLRALKNLVLLNLADNKIDVYGFIEVAKNFERRILDVTRNNVFHTKAQALTMQSKLYDYDIEALHKLAISVESNKIIDFDTLTELTDSELTLLLSGEETEEEDIISAINSLDGLKLIKVCSTQDTELDWTDKMKLDIVMAIQGDNLKKKERNYFIMEVGGSVCFIVVEK